MKKGIFYLCISTAEYNGNESIAEPQRLAEAFCIANGIKIVRVVSEVTDAPMNKRKGMLELLIKLLQNNEKIHCVLVTNYGQISPYPRVIKELKDTLAEMKIELIQMVQGEQQTE